LDVKQLEVLAAASQKLVDRAMEMARANARALPSGDSTTPDASIDARESAVEAHEPHTDPKEDAT
jgi:hypothetical protein